MAKAHEKTLQEMNDIAFKRDSNQNSIQYIIPIGSPMRSGIGLCISGNISKEIQKAEAPGVPDINFTDFINKKGIYGLEISLANLARDEQGDLKVEGYLKPKENRRVRNILEQDFPDDVSINSRLLAKGLAPEVITNIYGTLSEGMALPEQEFFEKYPTPHAELIEYAEPAPTGDKYRSSFILPFTPWLEKSYALQVTADGMGLDPQQILKEPNVEIGIAKFFPNISMNKIQNVYREDIGDKKILELLEELGLSTEKSTWDTDQETPTRIKRFPSQDIEKAFKQLYEVFTTRIPEWDAEHNDMIEEIPFREGNSRFIIPLSGDKALSLAGGRDVSDSYPRNACNGLNMYSQVSAYVVDYKRDKEGNIIDTAIDEELSEGILQRQDYRDDVITTDMIPLLHEAIQSQIQKDKGADIPAGASAAEVEKGTLTIDDLRDLSHGFEPNKMIGKPNIGGEGR